MEAKMEMSRHPVVVEGGRKKLSPRENQDHRHHRHHHLQRQVEEKEDRLQLLVDEFLAVRFQILLTKKKQKKQGDRKKSQPVKKKKGYITLYKLLTWDGSGRENTAIDRSRCGSVTRYHFERQ